MGLTRSVQFVHRRPDNTPDKHGTAVEAKPGAAHLA